MHNHDSTVFVGSIHQGIQTKQKIGEKNEAILKVIEEISASLIFLYFLLRKAKITCQASFLY